MRELTLFNDNRNPWRGLMEMQRNLDRVLDQVWGSSTDGYSEESFFRPSCDLEQTDSHYLLSFDLPGVSKNDIQIEVRDNHLILSGERKQERDEKRHGRFFSERSYGKFQRVLELPSDIDTEKIEANYRDGVLELAVPKAESAKPRKIQIGEGSGSFFGRLMGNKEEAKKSEKQTKAA